MIKYTAFTDCNDGGIWDRIAKSYLALKRYIYKPWETFTTREGGKKDTEAKNQPFSEHVFFPCVAFYDQQWAALNRVMKTKGACGYCIKDYYSVTIHKHTSLLTKRQ